MFIDSKNLKWIMVIALFIALLFCPLPLEGAMMDAGDIITIVEGETIDDDVYLFGETVTVNGTVLGNAIIFSSEAVIDGTVRGSLLVFAETIKINGNVEGTVWGGANNIYFQGSTGRDLIMMASSINIDGSVGKDYFGAANNSVVTGSIGRDMRASFNRLYVNAPVGGDIQAVVGDLTFGPEAVVEGKVNYTSDKEAVVDAQAVIHGALSRLDPPTDTAVGSPPQKSAWSFIRPILSLLSAALLMALLFPGVTGGTAQTIKERPGLSLGLGALVIFATPIVAVILLFTVIGLSISILSVLLYIVLIYLTRIFSGYFLAQIVFQRMGRQFHPVWMALTGVLGLALLVQIPYIGWLFHLAAVLFAAGAFLLYLSGKNEKAVTVGEQVPPRVE